MNECPICFDGFKSIKNPNPRIRENGQVDYLIQFTEPVQRPDGIYLKIYMYHPSHIVRFSLGSGPNNSSGAVEDLSYTQLSLIGKGSFQEGINIAGQAMYFADFKLQLSFSRERTLKKMINNLESDQTID